jgi:Transposase DDE domain
MHQRRSAHRRALQPREPRSRPADTPAPTYRLRKQLPEPVFGQVKQAPGFRQFLLRSLEKARAEWALICIAHNLLVLGQRWSLPAALPPAAEPT